YNYQNLLEQYMNQKTNKEVAHEVLNKMDLKYQQGVVSTLELTSANTDYLNAETNFTTVLLQLLNAELTLRKTNNKL
ncbi:MAG TPA: TolC family protein, partial [Bacteroidales bacterium]|nr:TolC family protein [Bacteroidales bacterium]